MQKVKYNVKEKKNNTHTHNTHPPLHTQTISYHITASLTARIDKTSALNRNQPGLQHNILAGWSTEQWNSGGHDKAPIYTLKRAAPARIRTYLPASLFACRGPERDWPTPAAIRRSMRRYTRRRRVRRRLQPDSRLRFTSIRLQFDRATTVRRFMSCATRAAALRPINK